MPTKTVTVEVDAEIFDLLAEHTDVEQLIQDKANEALRHATNVALRMQHLLQLI